MENMILNGVCVPNLLETHASGLCPQIGGHAEIVRIRTYIFASVPPTPEIRSTGRPIGTHSCSNIELFVGFSFEQDLFSTKEDKCLKRCDFGTGKPKFNVKSFTLLFLHVQPSDLDLLFG